MEDKKQLESGFQIKNILLIESAFKRVPAVTFNNPGIKQNINFDIDVKIKDNSVLVAEQITYTQIFNGIEEVSAVIKMAGTFEKIGDSPLDLDYFGHVNAAAIIFPFIREHLSNLSAKAGLGLIILPPINFTKKENKKE